MEGFPSNYWFGSWISIFTPQIFICTISQKHEPFSYYFPVMCFFCVSLWQNILIRCTNVCGYSLTNYEKKTTAVFLQGTDRENVLAVCLQAFIATSWLDYGQKRMCTVNEKRQREFLSVAKRWPHVCGPPVLDALKRDMHRACWYSKALHVCLKREIDTCHWKNPPHQFGSECENKGRKICHVCLLLACVMLWWEIRWPCSLLFFGVHCESNMRPHIPLLLWFFSRESP